MALEDAVGIVGIAGRADRCGGRGYGCVGTAKRGFARLLGRGDPARTEPGSGGWSRPGTS